MGISRLELWQELNGGVSIVEPILLSAYQREAEQEWRGETERGPATSFYVSSYPGDDPLACGRAAVYSLMGLPQEKPMDVEAMRWIEAGKHLEMDFTRRFAAAGTLLTGDESRGASQTKLGDPEVWSSGAVDAIILPFGWTQGHIVEVKNTSAAKLAAMKANPADTPWSHSKYVRQIKTYIGYAHEQEWAPEVTVCEESWAITTPGIMGLRWCPVHHSLDCQTKDLQLKPPNDGTLIYASRDPERGEELATFSYYFSYDPEFLAAGREKLAAWRAAYERGEIPEHPLENERKKWTAPPCKWCNYKKGVCKPDYSEGVKHLAESNATVFAQGVRPSYDYKAVRSSVFARWCVRDPLEHE